MVVFSKAVVSLRCCCCCCCCCCCDCRPGLLGNVVETNDVRCRCRCRDGARSIFGCHPTVMAPWYHNHPSPIENQQMDRSLPPSLISLHANTHTLSLSLLVGSFIHSFIFTTLDSTKLLCVYYLVGYNNWLMGTTVPLFLTLYLFSTFYLEINILDIS